MKRIVSLVLTLTLASMVLFVMPLTAGAAENDEYSSGETYGNYQYTVLDNGTVQIDKYSTYASTIVVPSEIDGRTVTVIGDSAFYGNMTLTSVTLPDTIT